VPSLYDARTHSVERQRIVFRRESHSLCPEHAIYISPSTYEHADYRTTCWLPIPRITISCVGSSP